ncbi:MAG: glycogen/starch synthase, partial [Muribaculum sp.]|nr:glycogen/starch synthase [Muribaculum sp.]
MEQNKILYISQELVPYLPSTPMSEHCLKLAEDIQEKGTEVRTFMPKYGCIKERRNQLHEVIRLSGLNIVIDDADHPLIIKVATLQPTRMQVYFIDNEDYFTRSQTATQLETELFPADNDERTIFFTRGVLETVKKLRWFPSVVHCSGWVAGLIPLYLKTVYAADKPLADSKIVFSLFNNKFDGTLDPLFKEK